MLWEMFIISALSDMLLSVSGFTVLTVLVRAYLARARYPQNSFLSVIRKVSINNKTAHAYREIEAL